MAKKKSKTNNYLASNWNVSNKLFETFELVTEKNKSDVIKIGRIVYCLEILGRKKKYLGHFEISPRMAKGSLKVSNHQFFYTYSIWITKTESMESYKERFKPVYNLIEQKKLYFKPEEGLVKYLLT